MKEKDIVQIINKFHEHYTEYAHEIIHIEGESVKLDNNIWYNKKDLSLISTDLDVTKGVKYSSDKVPLYTVLKQFREAFIEIAKRSQYGHEKYAEFDSDWRNFERLPNAEEEYGNALLRHLLNYGEDSELEHYTATAWDAIARLQVYLNSKK